MSWYDEMVAAGRSKSLTTGNVRCGVAVHEVLWSLALETPVNCHSELMEDSLRNIEPVQLRVNQMCQASVELPSITDRAAAFSKRCHLSVMVLGDPANTVLQPSLS